MVLTPGGVVGQQKEGRCPSAPSKGPPSPSKEQLSSAQKGAAPAAFFAKEIGGFSMERGWMLQKQHGLLMPMYQEMVVTDSSCRVR
jgi:hypothetical protein